MRHALIRALVVHFAEQAGYTGPLRVFTRVKSFETIRKRRKVPFDERRSYAKCYAVTLTGNRPAVWVNADQHTRLSELVDTAAHEAVHVADSHIPHGPEFDRRVRRLVRGGRL